ncbi:hypothetical protein KA005_08335, partial [bacterium]|nr:hypothetical protein [bacterium]
KTLLPYFFFGLRTSCFSILILIFVFFWQEITKNNSQIPNNNQITIFKTQTVWVLEFENWNLFGI